MYATCPNCHQINTNLIHVIDDQYQCRCFRCEQEFIIIVNIYLETIQVYRREEYQWKEDK